MATVLTVAGKADSRALVYPILYILKNYGRVMVATDDGAYRRLYHGYENIGEVSGVGVFVHPTLDLNHLSDAVNQYAPDFLVCVTNGYVPEYTTHLLVLTGYDRTMEAGNAFSKDEMEEGVKVTVTEADIVTAPCQMNPKNIREVIVSTTPVKGAQIPSVCLKEGLLMYAARCEEYKQLLTHDSRDFIDIIANILSGFVLPAGAEEIGKLFGFKK